MCHAQDGLVPLEALAGCPGSGGGAAEDRMRKISEKIAQKVKVENLVRNLKMTELEKFAKNKCESVEPLSGTNSSFQPIRYFYRR